MTQKSE